MGGAHSLFKENDWDLADGGLSSSDQTIDGAPPTNAYQTYYLIKKSVLANQREFDVTDESSNLLFHVRPIFGTIAGFDVLGVGSATSDEYKLRVTVDIARRHWLVYRFDKPLFEGQMPDQAATEKFAIEQQTERKELGARITASLAIHPFVTDNNDTNIVSPAPEPIIPKNFLYKVCCITVSWSRYMAVAAYFGPPTVEQLFRSKKIKEAVDEIAHSNTEDDELLLQEASRIAERMRERRSLADDLVDDEESEATDGDTDIVNNVAGADPGPIVAPPKATMNGDVSTSPTGSVTEDRPASTDAASDELNVLQDEESASPCAPVANETTPDEMKNKELADSLKQTDNDNSNNNNNSLEVQNQTTTATESEVNNDPTDCLEPPAADPSRCTGQDVGQAESVEPVEEEGTTTVAGHSQITMDTVEEHGADPEAAKIVQSVSLEELTIDETGNRPDDLPAIETSASMPDLPTGKNSSKSGTPLNGDKLRAWFKDTSRSLHSKSKLMLRQSHSVDDGENATIGGGSNHSANYAAMLGIGSKNAETENPLEGVIHLEKPLLLCQEIFTRIIGNHQTSRVSKAKVLSLLQQDMEQKVEGAEGKQKGEGDESKKSDDPETTNQKDEGNQVASLDKSPTATEEELACTNEVNEDKPEKSDPGNVDPMDTSTDSTVAPKEQPLVGYWAWEHSLRTHKVKMHLAKGSDLALHVVLAVLVNQVRYERNAIAIAV